MSAPKGPPKARHLIVPQLTSKTENGELYKGRADVEDSIAQGLAQPPSEWVAIATVKGEHRLADEALVFLIRAAAFVRRFGTHGNLRNSGIRKNN